jgi:TetR/AcrR family transcriptional regulator, transcriptional repressor for nem operon
MVEPYAASEKRSELVRAARTLLHQQGFHRTTLADVAGAAGVPLGNVYYYFKTKEALAEAVICAHEAGLRAVFAEWSKANPSPRQRLVQLIRAPLDSADGVIQFGCPHGSLCQELEKLGSDAPLAKASARLMSVYVDWAAQQFRGLGSSPGEARELASELVAAVQGTMLLAHTLRSREFLEKQLRRVERRLLPPARNRRSR